MVSWIVFSSALWFGILTSISPCPLATNIAAVSFLSKKIVHPGRVFITGIAYTLGRMFSYAIIGSLIISSLLSVPEAAQFLQKYMVKALGPILIVTGIILLEIIPVRLPGVSLSQKHQNKLLGAGVLGAFLLGMIFALAFCPVSAALFFGSLIPLALSSDGGSFLPFVFGVGTGLPVLLFSLIIALGVRSLSHLFSAITKVEQYTRKVTGIIFILVGLYYTAIYIFKIG